MVTWSPRCARPLFQIPFRGAQDKRNELRGPPHALLRSPKCETLLHMYSVCVFHALLLHKFI